MKALLLILLLVPSVSSSNPPKYYAEYHGNTGWGWGLHVNVRDAKGIALGNCIARSHGCRFVGGYWVY
jgi:hypothetical protein